jgi:hypothetical protein
MMRVREVAMGVIDWNRNGKIDPVDVGISIASGEITDCSEKDDADKSTSPKSIKRSGCLTSCLIFIASTITLISGIWRLVA